MRTSRDIHRDPLNRSTDERQKLALICGLSVLLAIVSVTRSAHSAAPAPPAAPAAEPQFIKSVFVNSPSTGFGKDPFFPKSKRFVVVAPTITNTVDVAPAPVTVLNLKGFSNSKGHRTAIINNRTFEVGEEAEIRVSNQAFRVKCVEIHDDGVIVSVNGQTQKLSIGPKNL